MLNICIPYKYSAYKHMLVGGLDKGILRGCFSSEKPFKSLELFL